MLFRSPLVDPDRWLERAKPWFMPLFGWFGALLWLGVVGLGITMAAMHWRALTSGALDHVFSAENLLLMWLIFPVVKTLHEFGHAIVAKAGGGLFAALVYGFNRQADGPHQQRKADHATGERRARPAAILRARKPHHAVVAVLLGAGGFSRRQFGRRYFGFFVVLVGFVFHNRFRLKKRQLPSRHHKLSRGFRLTRAGPSIDS